MRMWSHEVFVVRRWSHDVVVVRMWSHEVIVVRMWSHEVVVVRKRRYVYQLSGLYGKWLTNKAHVKLFIPELVK